MQTGTITPTIFNLKPELDDPDIVVLLALSVSRPTVTRMEEVCQMYQFDSTWLLRGYRIGRNVVGCIGFQVITRREARIRHVAVSPEWRLHGIGRTLVRHLFVTFPFRKLTAEAYANAVGFYRRCGFEVVSLGERSPGIERFLCTWELAG